MTQMDIELKRAFAEMQINKIETTKKIEMLDCKATMIRTGKQKFVLTKKATLDLDDDARVYLPIGRMFVLTGVAAMRVDLQSKQDLCDKAIECVNKKKEYLVQSLKEQEDGLRELVQQRREADSK